MVMNQKDYQDICNLISKTSPYIRFVGMIGKMERCCQNIDSQN